MLAQAKYFENELKMESIWARDLPRNKAFVFGTNGYINLHNNENEYCEMVSINSDSDNEIYVIGFMAYHIYENKAVNMEIINFKDNQSDKDIFSLDLKKFWKDIFEVKKLDSIEFSVMENTESAKKLLKIVRNYGGNVLDNVEGWIFCEVTKDNYYSRKGNKGEL